jgi:hypothetical protein
MGMNGLLGRKTKKPEAGKLPVRLTADVGSYSSSMSL